MKNKVLELFGLSTRQRQSNWDKAIERQQCPFIGKKCYKVRKSDPATSIGTCSVSYGREAQPIMICPARLLDKRQIFIDCLHLLGSHEPGNELHVVPEVTVPGGSVDFFLVSAKKRKVRDFVGIELQTLDTTGTIWPERQRLLRELNVKRSDQAESSDRPFGMNWKMTAKTILIQVHHKVRTFEHVNRKLVLVVQDVLLEYMRKEFSFGHLSDPALIGDTMHIHAYGLDEAEDHSFQLQLGRRISTDSAGVGRALGLQTEAKVELEEIIKTLEGKLSNTTLFKPV